MATMRVNAIARDDLFWRINYKHDRCTMCGKCLASCPFRAIEAGVEKRRRVISDHLTPKPKVLFQTVPVIRQVLNHHEACRGCGICEKVCPNEAIAPYFNKDNRLAIKYRSATADAYKRGGRSNLNPMGSTLDKITVGRISQMTDPSLDAQRHTFDILAPLGRVLPPQSLPLSIKEGRLDITRPLPPLNWMYPIIIGDMSIGALSTRMWEALSIATAYLNEEAGIPIRMCTGEGGIPGRLLRSRYVRYMILQIASGHFGWNRIVNAMPRMQDDPAGVLIKIGQGAKPGDGGMLQAKKVARHIQEIRGVPKTDLLSPPTTRASTPLKRVCRRCSSPSIQHSSSASPWPSRWRPALPAFRYTTICCAIPIILLADFSWMVSVAAPARLRISHWITPVTPSYPNCGTAIWRRCTRASRGRFPCGPAVAWARAGIWRPMPSK